MASESTLQRFARGGILPLSPAVGMQMLMSVLRKPPGAVVTVCPMDARRLAATPYLSGVRAGTSRAADDGAGSWDVWLEKLHGQTPEERRLILGEMVRGQVSKSVTVRSADWDNQTPWGVAGLDSLSMVELRNSISRQLGGKVVLSSTALFDYPCLDDLVRHIDKHLFPTVGVGSEVVYRAARVEPMAIVGMACRLPGRCDSPEELWRFLEGRGDGLREIPLTRMDWRKSYDASGVTEGMSYTNRGAFIDRVTLFDNARFGISAAEASHMDPQQRI
eukprot:3395894-Rhodomonas_salina.1